MNRQSISSPFRWAQPRRWATTTGCHPRLRARLSIHSCGYSVYKVGTVCARTLTPLLRSPDNKESPMKRLVLLVLALPLLFASSVTAAPAPLPKPDRKKEVARKALLVVPPSMDG